MMATGDSSIPSDGGWLPAVTKRLGCGFLLSVNQLCHGDADKTICRGGRNFQLQCWAEIGIIATPTDESLRKAMRSVGVEPKGHI